MIQNEHNNAHFAECFRTFSYIQNEHNNAHFTESFVERMNICLFHRYRMNIMMHILRFV